MPLEATIRDDENGKPFIRISFEGNSEPLASTESYETDRNMLSAVIALTSHGIMVTDARE